MALPNPEAHVSGTRSFTTALYSMQLSDSQIYVMFRRDSIFSFVIFYGYKKDMHLCIIAINTKTHAFKKIKY